MGKTKELLEHLGEKFVQLYKTGQRCNKMPKDLRMRMRISRIQTLLIKLKLRGSGETKPQSRRPTKNSATTVRKIFQDAKKTRQITSSDIQALTLKGATHSIKSQGYVTF